MWSIASIKPIFKSVAKYVAANCRPISMTCVACKLMETIVRNTMNDLTIISY